MRFKALLMAPLILTCTATRPVALSSAPCMGGLRHALETGRFTGPILCSPKNVRFTHVGETARGSFSIYDYRYRFLPLRGGVYHGGQRILIFRGAEYLGQYAVSPPPYVSISVVGMVLRIGGAAKAGNAQLDLAHGPPRKALISGYEVAFAR